MKKKITNKQVLSILFAIYVVVSIVDKDFRIWLWDGDMIFAMACITGFFLFLVNEYNKGDEIKK